MSLNNSDITISGCIIQNNGTGIKVYSSDATITGNSILDNSNYGIQADNVSSSVTWENNTIEGNGYAMTLNNSSPYIYDNLMTDNWHGVVINSSSPNFAQPYRLGYNSITCSATPLFKANNYSTVYMGYDGDGGYNSIFGSEMPDMESINHSGIYADNNYFGPYSPSTYADGTSWILARTPLSTDPNSGSSCNGLHKSSSFAAESSNPFDISNNYWKAIAASKKGDLSSAKTLLNSLITSNYDNTYSPLSLLALYELENNSKSKNNNEITSTLDAIYSSAKNPLRPFALQLLSRNAALLKDMSVYLACNKEMVSLYPNSEHQLLALYNLVNYYLEMENDLTHTQKYYQIMKKTYPEEDLTLFAAINIGEKVDINVPRKKDQNTTDKVNSFELADAYPNPFNPSTIIKYNIPEDGNVTVKIYDIMGREVATLVDEHKSAGSYNVVWESRNSYGNEVASGIYFYNITFKAQSITKKMLLVR